MRGRSLLVSAILAVGTACGTSTNFWSPAGATTSVLTFDKVLADARAGDAERQNLLGYMYFFGESAPHSWPDAAKWFETAAAQGQIAARYNLAIMKAMGTGIPRDTMAALTEFRAATAAVSALTTGRFRGMQVKDLPSLTKWACTPQPTEDSEGAQVFRQFCSGCHGWRGISAYGDAPSFALGERMNKSDGELLYRIRLGHGDMPSWEDKMPEQFYRAVIPYLRTLEARHAMGIIHVAPAPPDVQFRFGPMSDLNETEKSRTDVLFRPNPRYPRNFCQGAEGSSGKSTGANDSPRAEVETTTPGRHRERGRG